MTSTAILYLPLFDQDDSPGITEGEWKREKESILELRDIEHLGFNNCSKNAK